MPTSIERIRGFGMSNESSGQGERYVQGYGAAARDYAERRTADTHASFFRPYLKPGMRLLDCGCGPGSITVGLAEAISPGQVCGIDMEESQVELAREAATEHGISDRMFLVCRSA